MTKRDESALRAFDRAARKATEREARKRRWDEPVMALLVLDAGGMLVKFDDEASGNRARAKRSDH